MTKNDKILFIDNRERSGLEQLVIKYCDKNKLKYEVRQTHLTDYTFASVGIEAKSIEDYLGSLYSGHLERQLQNLDDNYAQPILLVWGTLDQYIAKAMKGGRKIPYARAFASYTGSLARFSNDFDIQIITFSDKSTAARFICKRFEKHGTLRSTATYRVMRRTATEDMRVDILRAAGCSDAIAKRLLKEHGSVAEIVGLDAKTLMQSEGVGKVRAERIMKALNSEEAIVQEKVKMSRA
jgi:ERCC4-type nuclease|tara:strand:+ start:271 stop:984 length:714 start_codon:yes stop_codon:yes gene_type:complete